MKTRAFTLFFYATALTAPARAQSAVLPPVEGFNTLGEAYGYGSAEEFIWGLAGVEGYIHSTITRQSKWAPVFDPGGKLVGKQDVYMYQVQFFVRDSATSPPGASPPAGPAAHGLKSRAAPAPLAATVYMTDQSYNAVRAIDPGSGAILGTVQLRGTGSPLGIAITPDGKFLWVCEGLIPANPNATEIDIIDTSSLTIIGSIPLGSLVAGTWIAMTPDGKTAYVTNYGLGNLGGSDAVNSILIIDVASRKVTGQILPPVINQQRGTTRYTFDRLAVSPDGTELYAVCDVGICVYDTLTNAQINPPPSPQAVVNIATFSAVTPTADTPIVVHPNGTRAYYTSDCPAPNGGNACLAVMNTTTNLLADAVTLGPVASTNPTGLGISADGRWLAVKEFNSGDWIIIDTTTDQVAIRTPGEPQTYTVFYRSN